MEIVLDTTEEKSQLPAWAAEIDAALSQAEATAQDNRKKRKRSRKDLSDDATRKDLDREAEKAEKLFDPKLWKALPKGIFDLIAVSLQRDCYRLTNEENEELSVPLAMTAEYFMPVHPKWIALTLLGAGLLKVGGSKAALHIQELKREHALRTEMDTNNKVYRHES